MDFSSGFSKPSKKYDNLKICKSSLVKDDILVTKFHKRQESVKAIFT